MGNAGQISAIRKIPQIGPVQVTTVGLVCDSQVFRHHGGVDKAMHQYAADHYDLWKLEKPDKAHNFEKGGFGENLVTYGMNENNVCIGDKFSIGKEVIVEINEPRLPCATLNRRFEWRRASIRAQDSGRSGWYMRVLQTGSIQAGDMMQLLERPNPTWTITACQKALYAKEADREMLLELASLPALGQEIRDKAQKKAQTGQGEDMFSRLHDVSSTFYPFKLSKVKQVTDRVKHFTFTNTIAPKPGDAPPQLSRFAYVRLKFGPDDMERSYSVVSGDWTEFTLGIAHDRNSRGGSRFLHQNVKVGDVLQIAKGQARPAQKPRKVTLERRRIFVVGGIGITAFIREIGDLEAAGARYEVHYATPSKTEAAFSELLPNSKTTYYAKDEGQRLDINRLIPAYAEDDSQGADIFCCGPNSLMRACEKRATELGYPEDCVHMESFGLEPQEANNEFEVEIEGSHSQIKVSTTETLLQALRTSGFDVPSSCEIGNCGLCAVEYVEGDVEHRGVALTQKEKKFSMLSCVSRCKGKLKLRNDF